MFKYYLNSIVKHHKLLRLPILVYFPLGLVSLFWAIAIAVNFPNQYILSYTLVLLPFTFVMFLTLKPFTEQVIEDYELSHTDQSKCIKTYFKFFSLLLSLLIGSTVFIIAQF